MVKQRYFLELCYDGTPYHGWQTQPNGITVQACLDQALTTYFRKGVATLGCGRTDTGVHATQFFAHFDLEAISDKTVEKALDGINALLPYTIAVKRIFKVEADAHARFDATARTYHYYVHFAKNPFKDNRSWLCKVQLDVAKMNEAAKLLLNYTDFTSFSKTHTQTFTNNCKLIEARFEQFDGGLRFVISADRFLRNMVRSIMGTLVQVGKGALTLDQLHEIVVSKNRSNAGQSVAACGLYLVKVQYPYVSE